MFPLSSFSKLDRSNLRTNFPHVESIFRDFGARQPVPGLAFGIVVDGELAAAGGIGVQNVADKTPVTPQSVFRIASMTKSFTAMAVVKLRDEGKLQLDDLVEQHVPQLASLRYPTRDSTRITVRHLLTMSAGFPQDDPWADRQLAVEEAQLSDWLENGISFSNPTGLTFEYSNYGYAILGRIVTNVSGVAYQTYIQEQILKPLGMSSTTFDVDTVLPERLAMGYRREANQWVAEPPLPDGAFASIGGMFTSISDFARYMAFLLSAFPSRDDPESGPVRRSSLREMQQAWRHRSVTSTRQTPNAPAVVTSEGYGYGLLSSIDSVLGYSVAHGGGLPGFGTFYRLLPDCAVGLVAFTNLTYAPVALAVNDALYTLRKTGELKQRALAPSELLLTVQDTITRLYERWDDGAMTSIATESFFLDSPIEKRRQQFVQLRATFGKCVSTTALEPENALRGRWIMKCRSGHMEVFATLSPTVPPRLQYLIITPAQSLSPALKRIVMQVVLLIDQWDDSQARSTFARKLKRENLRMQFDALRVQYGKLRLGTVLEGDGKMKTRVQLLGKHGTVDMKLVLNPKTDKVLEVTFAKPREIAFVP